MSVTFYICDPAMVRELDALIELMEEEDPLDESPDSAFERFASRLEANHTAKIELDEAQSSPAEAYYEWFHDRVNQDLDKLYLTPQEAARTVAALEKLKAKAGLEKLITGFWTPSDEYSRDEALAYFDYAMQALTLAVQHKGLMVIGYR